MKHLKQIINKFYFLIILVNLFFLIYVANKTIFTEYYNLFPCPIIIGIGLYISVFIMINHALEHINMADYCWNILAAIFLVLYGGLLLVSAQILTVIPQYDLNYIYDEVYEMLLNGGKQEGIICDEWFEIWVYHL